MYSIKIALTICVLLYSHNIYSGGSNKEKLQILITANAYKADFVQKNNAEDTTKGTYWVSDTFKFYLKDIKIKQGDYYKFPKQIALNLRARQKEFIIKSERLYFYLSIQNKDIEVLDWGIVSSFVCISEDKIDRRFESSYFHLTQESKELGEKCRYLKFFHDSPKVKKIETHKG